MKREDYDLTLISKGYFLDQPEEPGPVYQVEVMTYRMNRIAKKSWDMPAWLRGNEKDRRRRKAEEEAREFLGISKREHGWTFDRNREKKDILTVVHVRKLERIHGIIERLLEEK